MPPETLHHRGYDGSVEFSLEDGVLHGQVLFLKDLVTYEGETLAELKASFESAISAYLEACQTAGVEPDRPFRGSFNVRIPPELHRQCATFAAREGKSLNEFVCVALETAVQTRTSQTLFTPSFSPLLATVGVSIRAGLSLSETFEMPFGFAGEYRQIADIDWSRIQRQSARSVGTDETGLLEMRVAND